MCRSTDPFQDARNCVFTYLSTETAGAVYECRRCGELSVTRIEESNSSPYYQLELV